jgi:ankyrin repeat protein
MQLRLFIAVVVLQASPLWAGELHDAVISGDRVQVARLLAGGANVNELTYNDYTPLHCADDPAIVELLLRHKPKLGRRDAASAQTPLEHAADEACRGGKDGDNWRKIVKLLLDAGAYYDIQSAIYLNDLGRVRTLLTDNSKLANGRRGAQSVPLRVAAREGRYEICELLLKAGADPDDVEDGNGYSIVQEAVAYPQIVKLLIDAGVDLQRRITWTGGRTGVWVIGDEATVLHYAACDGVPETVNLLIDNGVDIFATAHDSMNELDKQTALEVASFFGRADNAAAILNRPQFSQADADYRKCLLDKCLLIGAAPSWMAEKANRPALIEALLNKGADPNANQNGAPAIQIAVRQIHPNSEDENQDMKKVAAVLLKHGANRDLFSTVAIGDEAQVGRLLNQDPACANERAADGCPALRFAVKMNYRNIVRQLLDAGCDVDIRNKCADEGNLDETALHCAAFWGRVRIARQLLEAGAKIDALTSEDRTPLHEAARMTNVRVTRLLLEHGARMDLRDRNGLTPAAGCGWKNAEEIKRVFREFGQKPVN